MRYLLSIVLQSLVLMSSTCSSAYSVEDTILLAHGKYLEPGVYVDTIFLRGSAPSIYDEYTEEDSLEYWYHGLPDYYECYNEWLNNYVLKDSIPKQIVPTMRYTAIAREYIDGKLVLQDSMTLAMPAQHCEYALKVFLNYDPRGVAFQKIHGRNFVQDSLDCLDQSGIAEMDYFEFQFYHEGELLVSLRQVDYSWMYLLFLWNGTKFTRRATENSRALHSDIQDSMIFTLEELVIWHVWTGRRSPLNIR